MAESVKKKGEDEEKRAGYDQEYEDQEEIGSTSGRKHADILEQTLPHDLAQKSALRRERSWMDK